MIAAENISMDAAMGAILSELDGIFALKEEFSWGTTLFGFTPDCF